ncbi:hypothetical protein RchiOBHm_Chr1g0349401 [Rosa chinensis]|uniref:Uncharacterized protein n=1 Tax=Rosa chinensis TaxID=74649 RepID=A0A2P6SFT5_ROSCH|nr:hypothetical protein RchiOBHm_Chr1g0349401 [Rosa chinensis]
MEAKARRQPTNLVTRCCPDILSVFCKNPVNLSMEEMLNPVLLCKIPVDLSMEGNTEIKVLHFPLIYQACALSVLFKISFVDLRSFHKFCISLLMKK